ncbi:UNVERIFIED_CONTAM: hypothetical protein FKN15_034139 [Acipenser sinensis]
MQALIKAIEKKHPDTPRLSRERLLRVIDALEAGRGQRVAAHRLGGSQPAISNLERRSDQTHSVKDSAPNWETESHHTCPRSTDHSAEPS